MNNINTIFLHWKKLQKDFEKNLAQLQQHINTTAVHDIRVAIKKLRAFLQLYALLKKEPELEYLLNKTENLFDVLGKYRDIEICLALTKDFEKEGTCDCKAWKHYLQTLLKVTSAWATEEIHHYHKKELAKIALLLKQDDTLTDHAAFFIDLSATIQTKLSETKKHFREPHLVRKKLKTVYYWISLFPEDKMPEAGYQKELHSILNDLGDWQDYEILAVRIKHFRKDYLPKPFEEYNLVKKFEIKINDNKDLLLKSAYRKAKRWIKNVLNTADVKSIA